jgi:uncharacterized membrane protein YkoI
MSSSLQFSRRFVLLSLTAGLLLHAAPASAKDGGGDDGGGDGGGGGGHGGDDGGGGHGGGGDDHNDDNHDNHGGGGSGGGGGVGNGGKGGGNAAIRARNAVSSGRAASLGDVLRLVRSKYEGDVIHVGLSGTGNSLIYEIQLLDSQNRRLEVRVNAVSRDILGAGFY